MNSVIKPETIEQKLIVIRNQKVLLDFDVAEIYPCPELAKGC